MTGLAYLEAAIAGDRDDWLVGSPLREEIEAARLSGPALARVMALEVPLPFLSQLTGAGDIGAARVTLYRPTAPLLEAGRSRAGRDYFELGGPDARLLLAVREQGELVDLVALATHDPDQWALRRGEGWCLGYDAWLACETGRAFELRVHATPIAWLQSGGTGLCVLDWDIGLRMLRGLGEGVLLRCDRGAGERLSSLLRLGGLPRVKETGPAIRRAA